MSSAPTSSFDVLTGPVHDALLAESATVTTRAVTDPSYGVLVVVVRPTADDHQVISGGGSGVLRAAVSVAVAAGNDRLWRDAPDGDTEQLPARALPEVIAAAAEGDGVRHVHTGRVVIDGEVDAVAIWFETWSGVADADERRSVLTTLRAAALTERERRAALAEATPTDATAQTEAAGGERTFDPNDPDLDGVTGVYTSDWFDDHLADNDEREEAMLVLIDIDGFAPLSEEFGEEAADGVLRVVADRLVANCRRDDVIARIGHDRFAIVFGDIERSQVMTVAKRILSEVAEPLPAEIGPSSVTATVALSHQVGLIDIEEMLESAVDALGSGKRSGAGRLVLAA